MPKYMSLLVETVKVMDGVPQNLRFHNVRMNRTRAALFGLRNEIDLGTIINVPESASTGNFKCRIEYDDEIRITEFLHYIIKPVTSLRIVEDNNIEYMYKFKDRIIIDVLTEQRGECDDIIILKNGYVTDSSYANLIFQDASGKWVTPSSCLLPGTMRASLLYRGLIKESVITLEDIPGYSTVKLINAMIGIDDTAGIPVSNIL